jgi:hypothetical protein
MTKAASAWKVLSVEQESESEFNTKTARLLRREALRRAAEELNSTSGPGLESVLGRISDEVTAEALEKLSGKGDKTTAEPSTAPPRPHPSKP